MFLEIQRQFKGKPEKWFKERLSKRMILLKKEDDIDKGKIKVQESQIEVKLFCLSANQNSLIRLSSALKNQEYEKNSQSLNLISKKIVWLPSLKKFMFEQKKLLKSQWK